MGFRFTCLGVTDAVQVSLEFNCFETDFASLSFVGLDFHFVRGQDHVTADLIGRIETIILFHEIDDFEWDVHITGSWE